MKAPLDQSALMDALCEIALMNTEVDTVRCGPDSARMIGGDGAKILGACGYVKVVVVPTMPENHFFLCKANGAAQ